MYSLLIENWHLSHLYFYSDERAYSRGMLLLLIFMELVYIGLGVSLSYWNNSFFNALQSFNQSSFVRLLGYFFLLILTIIVVGVYKHYLAQLFKLRWRSWLTNYLLSKYLSDHAYYEASLLRNDDNPDQRISMDVETYIENTYNLTIGAINSTVSFFAYVIILWSLSGVIKINITQYWSYEMRGSMVWAAIVYAGLGKSRAVVTSFKK